MRFVLGIAVFCAIGVAVVQPGGALSRQAMWVRLYGVAALFIALVFSLRQQISVHVRGGKELATLSGRKTLYVILPLFLIGTSLVLFPHEVACAIKLRNYVCP